MATLTAGEKARMYALGKIMRGGASRGGYVSSQVFIAIDGVQVGWGATPHRVLLDTLTITDELDETPNTCAFRVKDVVPAAGSEVVITLGSKHSGKRLYAGFALTVQQLYVGDKPANVQADVRCVDYTWQFGFVLVTAQYRSMSATAIARALIAAYAAGNGFTSDAVAPYLPVLDEITFTNEPLDAALTRIARRIGGYWYVDYQKVVHLFLEDTTNAPADLTPQHKSLRAFQRSADRTQVLTRVYVEGRGSAALATVGPGETLIPLDAVDMFAPAPDVFVKVSPVGSTGGAQFLTFTGVTAGGSGALVGSGTAPSSVPVLTAGAGGAVPIGDHYYVYTWVSAAGETVASPGSIIAITSSVPTASAPTVSVQVGPGLPPGTYQYAATHVLASGETAWTPANQTAVCTRFLGTAFGAPGARAWVTLPTNLGAIGDQVETRLAFRSTTALSPATVGPTSARVTLVACAAPNQAKPSGLEVSFNLSLPMSANYLDVQVRNVTTGGAWGTVQTYSNVGGGGISAGCYVGVVTPTTAATETGGLDTASVQVTVGAAPAGTTARRIYRTKVNASTLYLVKDLPGAALTSFVDTTPDSALVTRPPAGLAAAQTVTVSGIATGPHTGSGGTTARKVYRWDASVWYLLTTIANNTATTFVDTVATASLTPATWPATDTSGLLADGGQVLAGATTIPVSGTGAFPATGGWVLSGNNRVHYGSVAGAALTGIPATGDGSILNTIPYGTPVTLAPMLTGVAGIVTPLSAGDELYLVVQIDDAARQATVADMVNGGPGVREEWVQDRRLSIAEARARGQATLALRPLEAVTVTYACRDLRTASGKTITVNLPPPTNVFGTFKIQSVTINNFRPHPTQYPTFTVTASSQRFNFEDWLRRMETSP